jgi:hypothetical protein
MATPEQLDLRRKWVEALRSGEWTQATGQLWDGTGYCCLGVLCKVAGLRDDELAGKLSPPKGVLRAVGLPTAEGWVEGIDFGGQYPVGVWLTTLNDSAKFTFEQIADVIETHPELWEPKKED